MSNPTVGEIPDHWEFTTLGDVCDRGGGNIQTGPFGSQLHASDYVEEGIPSIMPVNIGDNRLIETDIKRITEEDAQRLSKHLVVPGDIIYSRRGDVERRALVREEQRGWFCGTGCIKVRLGEGVVDPAFASFYLDHPNVREWIVQHAVGATMPNLNTSIMKAIPFALPPPEEQRAIASILGALDDKIELNRRMNATLESLARAIFKSWFVDFDPVKINAGQMPASSAIPTTHDPKVLDLFPSTFQDSELGPIPDGWKVERADKVYDVAIGKTPPRKQKQWFTTNPDDIRWMSIRDMGSSGVFISVTSERLTEAAVEQFNVRRIPDQTVVLSFKLTVGRVAITDGEMLSNEAIAHFKMNESSISSPEYLYCYLRDFDYGSLGSTSSIATAVNSKTIKAMPILVPTPSAIAQFTDSAVPLFEQIRETDRETRMLSKLRDTLLPQLLSGNLPVPAALTEIEEALV